MGHQVEEGGLYRHFKGDMYVVLAVLKSSSEPDDISQDVVGYMNLNTGERYWRSYRDSTDGFIVPKKHPNGIEEERFTFWGTTPEIKITGGKYYVTLDF